MGTDPPADGGGGAVKGRKQTAVRPVLSRGWRVVRNLAAAGLLLLSVWAARGFPLPTDQLRFHWAQRADLAAHPVPMQLRAEIGREVYLLGADEKDALLFQEGGKELLRFPRQDGATLVPIPDLPPAEELWVGAVDVPEGTASARLEVTLSFWYAQEEGEGEWKIEWADTPVGEGAGTLQYWEKTYEGAGELREDGGVLFQIVPGEQAGALEEYALGWACDWDTYQAQPGGRFINCRMEAVFYDESGRALERAQLSTPEE